MLANRRPPVLARVLPIAAPSQLQRCQELLEREVPETDAPACRLLDHAAAQALEAEPLTRPVPALLGVEGGELATHHRVDLHDRGFQVARRAPRVASAHHGERWACESPPGEPVGEAGLLPLLRARRD